MYSAEQRKKAIETFARFGCSAADTIAELGYPNRNTLRNWWKEYQLSGDEFLEGGGIAGRSTPTRRSRMRSITTWSTGKPRADDKGHGIRQFLLPVTSDDDRFACEKGAVDGTVVQGKGKAGREREVPSGHR